MTDPIVPTPPTAAPPELPPPTLTRTQRKRLRKIEGMRRQAQVNLAIRYGQAFVALSQRNVFRRLWWALVKR